MSGTEQIPVAKCPNCGYVYGDDLDYHFPNPSECQICGEETENTTVADEETVRSLAEGGLRADGGTLKGDTEHLEQSIPWEWHAVDGGDRTFIVRNVPEGTAELYVVSAVSRNVRTFARADAAIYDGKVVSTHYDEKLRTVEFQHDYAGNVGRHSVGEWLDEPAVRLKRLPEADLSEVFDL
jgi:hypothetical protein